MRITPKQKALLTFVCNFTAENGYAPSQREIADHFGWKSLGTVQDYLKKLEAKGVLKKEWNARRAIEVDHRFVENFMIPKESVSVPLLGKIAAGRPIEAIVSSEERIPVPKEMVRNGSFYALTVEGNSMIEDGIFEGDYIVVRRQQNAENGEMVVALVDNSATVKRMYRQKSRIELRPANETMESFYVKPHEVKVQGIVVGLYRKY
ncbi:transcriptional repressor LexA [Candidatus Uabimicrobium amorphum]|uniref:LexA repressor n=1 Tax=Uabimicrobium amorphum TaxID=2596890 RepID=A0A5S9F223_UABAM|nr:transcriptional repressor LexA [Candidatus Uabimicrobium amorphum]BBM81934.1 LexA repressor [Candidatus Uabimicrobium amorphum]